MYTKAACSPGDMQTLGMAHEITGSARPAVFNIAWSV